MDFGCEIRAQPTAIYLHFPFWAQHDFAEQGISTPRRDQLLADIRTVWTTRKSGIDLTPGVDVLP